MDQVDFGYAKVERKLKAYLVGDVFSSVAPKYDVMNDLMSFGMHRLWKKYTVLAADIRPGYRILDVASGSGDLAVAFARKLAGTGLLVQSDINAAMLKIGRDRLLNAGHVLPAVLCNAEQLPFSDAAFDVVSVAFGLRNMTDKAAALSEMRRVLRPRGKLLVLEFSKVLPAVAPIYDWYSFQVLPRLGQLVAGDAQSYRYLAESIRMHPAQAELAQLMKSCGFAHVDIHNMALGAVALHVGRVAG